MSFEEKLKTIKPIKNIGTIKAGKEWNQIAFYIKDRIVGRENYKKASEQKDALKVHVVEMLNRLNYLSYRETTKIIERVFSEVFPDGSVVYASLSEVSFSTGVNGDIEYFYKNEQVRAHWLPSVTETKKQVILQYDEYNRLLKVSQQDMQASKESKSSTFTFKDIIKKAAELGTSDVHILYGQEYYNVFFKIDGRLSLQTDYFMSLEDGIELIKQTKIDAAAFTKGEFNPDAHYAAQDAKIEYPDIGNDGIDVRLAFVPDGKLQHIALISRLLKRTKLEAADFGKMGYDDDLIEKIEIVSKRQSGLVISSGVTGSGKSTFISNFVVNIDQTKRVYTIEDPIEYFISNPNVTQHQVYEPKEKDKKVGFKEFTKALKRGDPDVVYIGEMRNEPELIQSVGEMSEAGQLVVSTLHINSAFSIYESLRDVFGVSPHVSIPIILFSINQVLVPKLCPSCKIKDTTNTNIANIKRLRIDFPYQYTEPLDGLIEEVENGNIQLYKKGDGCAECDGGYVGRAPIYEYFVPNVKFKEWLHKELPSRYAIEDRACKEKIGVNKLDTFCRKLQEGVIDASDKTVYKIM